jgi:hypothetical protein
MGAHMESRGQGRAGQGKYGGGGASWSASGARGRAGREQRRHSLEQRTRAAAGPARAQPGPALRPAPPTLPPAALQAWMAASSASASCTLRSVCTPCSSAPGVLKSASVTGCGEWQRERKGEAGAGVGMSAGKRTACWQGLPPAAVRELRRRVGGSSPLADWLKSRQRRPGPAAPSRDASGKAAPHPGAGGHNKLAVRDGAARGGRQLLGSHVHRGDSGAREEGDAWHGMKE